MPTKAHHVRQMMQRYGSHPNTVADPDFSDKLTVGLIEKGNDPKISLAIQRLIDSRLSDAEFFKQTGVTRARLAKVLPISDRFHSLPTRLHSIALH